jgi:hypothetical protein
MLKKRNCSTLKKMNDDYAGKFHRLLHYVLGWLGTGLDSAFETEKGNLWLHLDKETLMKTELAS